MPGVLISEISFLTLSVLPSSTVHLPVSVVSEGRFKAPDFENLRNLSASDYQSNRYQVSEQRHEMDFKGIVHLRVSVVPELDRRSSDTTESGEREGDDSSTRKPGGNKTQMLMVFR